MKISCIIPTRGDRTILLNHCIYQLKRQTVKPDHVILVDYRPVSNDYDIVTRIRKGYEEASKKSDIVFIVEDDDYYPATYIESVINLFGHNMPDLVGIDSSIYYHVKHRRFTTHNHPGRSSLFCTVLKAGLEINWPADNYRFLDMHIWKDDSLSKGFYEPKVMPIGIKHGIGKTGGNGHKGIGLKNSDKEMKWIRDRVSKDSYELYRKL